MSKYIIAVMFCVAVSTVFAQNVDLRMDGGTLCVYKNTQFVGVDHEENQKIIKKISSLVKANRYRKAKLDLVKLITTYPNCPQLYINLSVILTLEKRFDSARDALLLAFKTNDVYKIVFENLMEIDRAQAISAYRNVLAPDAPVKNIDLKLSQYNDIMFTNLPVIDIKPIQSNESEKYASQEELLKLSFDGEG